MEAIKACAKALRWKKEYTNREGLEQSGGDIAWCPGHLGHSGPGTGAGAGAGRPHRLAGSGPLCAGLLGLLSFLSF